MPYSIVLCFIMLCQYCLVYRLKVCDNCVSYKSVGTSFQHLLTLCLLCYIFIILTMFQKNLNVVIILICDLGCYYCNCFGVPQPHLYKTANWIDKYHVCSDCSTRSQLSPFCLFLGPHYFLRYNNIDIRPFIIILQWPLSVQMKGGVAHLSL